MNRSSKEIKIHVHKRQRINVRMREIERERERVGKEVAQDSTILCTLLEIGKIKQKGKDGEEDEVKSLGRFSNSKMS